MVFQCAYFLVICAGNRAGRAGATGGVCWLGVHTVEALRLEVKDGATRLKPKCGVGLRRRPKTHPVWRYRLLRRSDAAAGQGWEM
jgi:hypothetical protein